jgi:prepilin-type processing-associated H-X9-DG protein
MQELLAGQTDYRAAFGSVHPNGCQMLLCDGSVHTMGYDLDVRVHAQLCNRRDGVPVPAKVLD